MVLGSVGSAAGRLLMPMLSDKIGRRPESGSLAEPPLHPQFQDDGAEQQHRRCREADRPGAEPVLPGAEHLPRREIQRRCGFLPPLLVGAGRFGRRVGQQETARQTDRQRQQTQGPERTPDALHRPEALQRQPDECGQEGTGQADRSADDAGRQPFAAFVPFLGAGLDGGVEKRCAQPGGNAERPVEHPARPVGQECRCEKSAAEQGSAPERGCFRPLPILQKPAHHAPDAKRGDQEAEGIACALLGEAVFLHDRLLEYAPCGRKPGQDLNGGTCEQDRPRVLCGYLLHFVSPQRIVCPF